MVRSQTKCFGTRTNQKSSKENVKSYYTTLRGNKIIAEQICDDVIEKMQYLQSASLNPSLTTHVEKHERETVVKVLEAFLDIICVKRYHQRRFIENGMEYEIEQNEDRTVPIDVPPDRAQELKESHDLIKNFVTGYIDRDPLKDPPYGMEDVDSAGIGPDGQHVKDKPKTKLTQPSVSDFRYSPPPTGLQHDDLSQKVLTSARYLEKLMNNQLRMKRCLDALQRRIQSVEQAQEIYDHRERELMVCMNPTTLVEYAKHLQNEPHDGLVNLERGWSAIDVRRDQFEIERIAKTLNIDIKHGSTPSKQKNKTKSVYDKVHITKENNKTTKKSQDNCKCTCLCCVTAAHNKHKCCCSCACCVTTKHEHTTINTQQTKNFDPEQKTNTNRLLPKRRYTIPADSCRSWNFFNMENSPSSCKETTETKGRYKDMGNTPVFRGDRDFVAMHQGLLILRTQMANVLDHVSKITDDLFQAQRQHVSELEATINYMEGRLYWLQLQLSDLIPDPKANDDMSACFQFARADTAYKLDNFLWNLKRDLPLLNQEMICKFRETHTGQDHHYCDYAAHPQFRDALRLPIAPLRHIGTSFAYENQSYPSGRLYSGTEVTTYNPTGWEDLTCDILSHIEDLKKRRQELLQVFIERGGNESYLKSPPSEDSTQNDKPDKSKADGMNEA